MDQNKIEYSKPVPPFVRYCSAIIPTMFDDSLSYYEALCALWKWLQDNLINVVNNNATVTEEYIRLTNELKEYVENYFENLDVQEEINNKLDEMTESGQLSDLIAQYIGLGALVVFDTFDEMIESSNLSDGTKCKTLGKNTKNDGYGAYYTISTTGEILLDNGLYATLIPDFGGNNYFSNITTTQIRRYNTDCYVTTIPVNDSLGNIITPEVEYSTDTPLVHAQKTFSTVTINASLNVKEPYSSTKHIPNIIGNGELLREYNGFVGSDLADNYMYLGFKPDRTYAEYNVNNTNSEALLSSGCTNVIDVYYKLVENGVATDLTDVVTNEPDVATNPNPRQCIGVKNDGTIIILTCDGRTGNDAGLTSAETQNILIELECKDAWNLDGGGSTSTSVKGSKVNRNIDNNRSTERYIPYTINFKSKIIDKELAKVYSQIGAEKQSTLEQVYESVVQNASYDCSGLDLDELTSEVLFSYGNGMTHKPTSDNGYFTNIPHSQAKYRDLYSIQDFYVRDKGNHYRRYLIDGTFTSWQPENLYYRKTNNTVQSISSSDYVAINYSQGDSPTTNDVSEIVTISSDDDNFTINKKYGTLVVRGLVTISGSTAGGKFIELTKDGTRVSTCLFRYYYDGSGNEKVLPYEFCCNLDSSTHKFAVRYSGHNGDSLARKQVVIELK